MHHFIVTVFNYFFLILAQSKSNSLLYPNLNFTGQKCSPQLGEKEYPNKKTDIKIKIHLLFINLQNRKKFVAYTF